MADILENIDKNKLSALAVPLIQFVQQSDTYHDLLYLTKDGLSVVSKLRGAADLVEKYSEEPVDFSEIKEHLNRRIKLAEMEIEKGFPFLYNHATLMLYAQLEGVMKRLITEFFKIEGVISEIKELAKIKISISEYLELDETEKYEYLFQQYEKSNTQGLQYGVKRFETLLKPIGLSGEVNKDVKKVIFELSQIRNNLIHRGGVVDKHLASTCNWLNFEIGDQILISKEIYDKYYISVHKYVIAIGLRIGNIMGQDMNEAIDELSEFERAMKAFSDQNQ